MPVPKTFTSKHRTSCSCNICTAASYHCCAIRPRFVYFGRAQLHDSTCNWWYSWHRCCFCRYWHLRTHGWERSCVIRENRFRVRSRHLQSRYNAKQSLETCYGQPKLVFTIPTEALCIWVMLAPHSTEFIPRHIGICVKLLFSAHISHMASFAGSISVLLWKWLSLWTSESVPSGDAYHCSRLDCRILHFQHWWWLVTLHGHSCNPIWYRHRWLRQCAYTGKRFGCSQAAQYQRRYSHNYRWASNGVCAFSR